MARHLQKIAGGILRVGSPGAWFPAWECCCNEESSSSSSESSESSDLSSGGTSSSSHDTSSAGGSPCNCYPALDSTYSVTLSGFSGASDTRYWCADGTYELEWTEKCTWYGRFSGDCSGTTRYWDLTLYVDTLAAPARWKVRIRFCNSSYIPTSCAIEWKLDIAGGDPCPSGTPPPGAYDWWASDFGCAGNADEAGVVSCSVV